MIEILTSMGITPAYAGNTEVCYMSERACRDHPRLRWEYQYFPARGKNEVGSPPLTRGIRPSFSVLLEPSRITPAYAGNTSSLPRFLTRSWDHPRLRGEYPPSNRFLMVEKGSPPLTRGIRKINLHLIFSARITPAYAGNTQTDS